jgi:hypothetical protein
MVGGSNGELNETLGRKSIIYINNMNFMIIVFLDMHIRCLKWHLICDVFKL